MVMYADDSTMYSAALTYQELTDAPSTELRAVADLVKMNKSVLNVSGV